MCISDYLEKQKKLIQDFNALAWIEVIFSVIIMLLAFASMSNSEDSVFGITGFLIGTVCFLIAFLMFYGKKHAIKKESSAFTFGIIVGILLIITFNITNIILGILVIIDSCNYNSYINGNKE